MGYTEEKNLLTSYGLPFAVKFSYVQMPTTASPVLGEVIMIHSCVKCLVLAMSSAWAFLLMTAYTGYVFSRELDSFPIGIYL